MIITKCKEYQLIIDPLLKKYSSFRLHLWSYFLLLRMEELKSNFHGIIKICDTAINFFSLKSFVSDQFTGAFYYHKLKSLIQIRDFEKAFAVATKSLKIFEESTIRWYNAQEYCFLLNLQYGSYQKSLIIREKVTSSNAFNQFIDIHEKWLLFDAYLYFLYLIRRISPTNSSTIKKFRIKKFLNEVPVFSMDKSGYNIPVLVIQILIQIQQKRHDQLTDKIEAIEKYTTRYLRKDNNYRSNCFIKMLLQIPKQHFHRIAVERHTKSLLTKLKAIPLEKAKQPFEIEIIPYEDLWEMALESIG